MRFGIVTDYYGGSLPLTDALRRLANAGIKDVEITAGHLADDVANPPGGMQAESMAKGIRNLMSDLDITPWQLHGPYGACELVGESEAQRSRNIDIYKRWIDLGLGLGAGALIIHIGGRSDLCPVKDLTIIRDKNADSLSRLVDHVGDGFIRLAIENLASRSVENPGIFSRYGGRVADLKGILAIVDSPVMGICLDTGHANLENQDVPESVKTAGVHLAATHINENNGVYDMHMFPFCLRRRYSKMDWFAIFKALKEIEYPNPFIAECANTSGELPLEVADIYLRHQKELLNKVLASVSEEM